MRGAEIDTFKNMKSVRQQLSSKVRNYSAPYQTTGVPCVGLCKSTWHMRELELAYLKMAVIRNVTPQGLLVFIINTTSSIVDVIWRDYDDEDILLIKVYPGDTVRFSCLLSHRLHCRNTRTRQAYLLNSQTLFNGSNLFGVTKHKILKIEAAKTPMSLRDIAINSVVSCLTSVEQCVDLPLPSMFQSEISKTMLGREEPYYSREGEPGEYRKHYDIGMEGPLIYPSTPDLDWSAFDSTT